MNYREIIEDNCKNSCEISWWPKYAYHYTDVTNAVSILSSGFLYSRTNAEKLGRIQADGASKQIIDLTRDEAKSFVRFYFRPMTPTQYYNEGYKHPQLRYLNDINANVPVPIFFVFDLERLLSMPQTKFSETSQAGRGSRLYNGINAFSKLNFKKIYSNGASPDAWNLKKYRHAEILHPNAFPIDAALDKIYCRNEPERTTLLTLLWETDVNIYYKYKDLIKISEGDMFEYNGLFISNCKYHNYSLLIEFSNSYEKREYLNSHKSSLNDLAVKAKVNLSWLDSQNRTRWRGSEEREVDYEFSKALRLPVPIIFGAEAIRVSILIDNQLMYYGKHRLN